MRKNLTLVVLLDLSKAFDSLDHSRLLAKKKTLGVGCTTLEWFGSYLSGHQQYIRIGTEASSLGAISHGVPKGSILGPALFTIYMNDLPNILKFGSLESDFDDSRLYSSFSLKDTCSVVQQIKYDNLSKIAYWCCYNSLLINPDKTKLAGNLTNATLTTCRLSRLSTWKGSYYSLLCTRPGTSSRLHP